jgi:NADP-dependent aldehyde dehydrogenase
MSSINPVVVLPGVLAEGDVAALATAYVGSLTLGAGQFCTNPGLLIALESPALDKFVQGTVSALQAKGAATMLTPGIHQAYTTGVAKLGKVEGVTLLAQGQTTDNPCSAVAALYTTDAATFLAKPELEDEIFGPCSLLIRCHSEAQLIDVAEHVEGQLTAAVHATGADIGIAKKLLPTLERKAGRILFNGFGTGVEVAHAMVHGGPFPSTSDSRSTSVGASAIDRFLRPVCYQDVPAELLPAALAGDNPLAIPRVVDGELVLK